MVVGVTGGGGGGGVVVTVRVAAVELAVPMPLVNTARYWLPLFDVAAAGVV